MAFKVNTTIVANNSAQIPFTVLSSLPTMANASATNTSLGASYPVRGAGTLLNITLANNVLTIFTSTS